MRTALIAMVVVLTSVLAAPQAAPPRQVNLTAALQGSYAGQKATVLAEAAKMPEAEYSFKPSAMPEVRTFGRVIGHIAEAQFSTCANVGGGANPNQGRHLEQDLTTKAEITKALADSFALCDAVFAATTDENALLPIRVTLGPRVLDLPRVSVLYGLLAHTAEMYGVGTVYLRAKGLVPPASEPQGRGRGDL